MASALARAGRWGGGVAFVLVVVGLDLVLFSTLLNDGDTTGSPAVAVLAYAVAGGAVLFWQRRGSPLIGYAVLWAHAVGSVVVTGYRPTLPLLVGLYVVAANPVRRAAAWAALAAAVVPIGLAVAEGVQEAPPGEGRSTFAGLSILLLLVHCGAFAIGWWARLVRTRTRDLEDDREVVAHDAVEVERTRIAHELHDIVGHSVTLMTLQAAGARKVMRHDPARADEALAQVSGAGAQTMADLRRMLGGLRAGGPNRLDHLDELLSGVRAAGVTVTVAGQRPPAASDSTVDHVAYRIVQEALTNVVKHAGPGTHASITFDWQPRQVTVDIADDGRGHPAEAAEGLSSGHGLNGLSQRAEAIGGRLEAIPSAGGGFHLRATLPIQPERSDDGAARLAG